MLPRFLNGECTYWVALDIRFQGIGATKAFQKVGGFRWMWQGFPPVKLTPVDLQNEGRVFSGTSGTRVLIPCKFQVGAQPITCIYLNLARSQETAPNLTHSHTNN